MPITKPRRSLEELGGLGGVIFDRQVRPALRPEDDGKFVAIDVETGDYEIDEDDYSAVARLRSRKPAADVWLMHQRIPDNMPDRGEPMIQGFVNARHEAVVRLRVRGPSGVEADVDAIVDSGFTSSLTLPMALITALGLPRQSGGIAMLADGSVRHYDIVAAEVAWGSTWRTVLVSVVGNESLLGMRLLAGHKLVVDVVPGGLVEITPLP